MGYNKVQELIAPCVVSADDHDLFRKILSLTLEEEAGVHVAHTAYTGKEAVEATLKYKPDIVLMDISMPEMDGLAALSILKYISPETTAIIITTLVHPLYMARAGELGVQGFFSKGGTSKELVNAIGALLSGQKLPVEPKHMPELATPSVPGFAFP